MSPINTPLTFQFTPLREGRLGSVKLGVAHVCFNSRPCVRGDRRASAAVSETSCFNSRPCVRGDSCHKKFSVANGLYALFREPVHYFECQGAKKSYCHPKSLANRCFFYMREPPGVFMVAWGSRTVFYSNNKPSGS